MKNKNNKLPDENVWDYPRPAVCEPFAGQLRVIFRDIVIAKTSRAFRTLETSHPPTYYIPQSDIHMDLLSVNDHATFCEWKGQAGYLDLTFGSDILTNIGWFYSNPTNNFQSIKDYVSFYASKVDECFVNDELVQAQEGDFYGGWITSNLKGPFKGGAGTHGW